MKKKWQAFTIVELLVAIGVSALLVTMMLTITINVLKAWNKSSGNLTAANQARFFLDQISRDLEGAVVRRNSDVWFAATIQADQSGAGDVNMTGVYASAWSATGVKPSGATSLELNPTSRKIEDYRFGKSGVWLRFFTVPPDNSSSTDVTTISAPRAVAYQFVRNRIGSTAASTEFAYLLYRTEVYPGTASGTLSTFANGYNLFMAAGAGSYNTGNGSDGHPGLVRRPNGNSVIANNVVDFGVRIFERDSTGNLVETFPVDRRPAPAVPGGSTQVRVFASSTDTAKRDPFLNTSGPAFGYPAAVDVMVRILTPEGAKILNAYEAAPANFSGTDWWTIVLQNSQVFSRRVFIKSSAL